MVPFSIIFVGEFCVTIYTFQNILATVRAYSSVIIVREIERKVVLGILQLHPS